MSELARRSFLHRSLTGLTALSSPAWAFGSPAVPPRADSPRVGLDPVVSQSGLASCWEAVMRRDLGWAAQWSVAETANVLDDLEHGQRDAGLFLAHPRAEALDRAGLIFNRHTVARTDVLLLGPQQDLAGISTETDPARALGQVLAAYRAGAARWQAPPEGSALAALLARLVPGQTVVAHQMTSTPSASHPMASVYPAYRLATRAQWPGPSQRDPLKSWFGPHVRLTLDLQVACSFRSHHPGAKLLVDWLQGPLAQRAVRSLHPAWSSLQE
jgi:hypothetical protein